MDGGLRVRSESSPLRCEICHKSDCLDPDTGECSRCCDIVVPEELILARIEEEKPRGLIIPFNRSWRTQITAALLSVMLGISLVGPIGIVFFIGLCCFITGLHRVLSDAEVTGWPKLDFALNLMLMSAGLTGCCYGGLYFLRLISG
jgi:hypothetical protein